MPSYYMSEDLARFGEIAKVNPTNFDMFLKWYTDTMEPGVLDGKTKKLIALAVAYAFRSRTASTLTRRLALTPA